MQLFHGYPSEDNSNLPNITQKTEDTSIMWAFCTAADSAKNHLSSHSPPLPCPCPDYLTHFSGFDSAHPQGCCPSRAPTAPVRPLHHVLTTTHTLLQKLKPNDQTA